MWDETISFDENGLPNDSTCKKSSKGPAPKLNAKKFLIGIDNAKSTLTSAMKLVQVSADEAKGKLSKLREDSGESSDGWKLTDEKAFNGPDEEDENVQVWKINGTDSSTWATGYSTSISTSYVSELGTNIWQTYFKSGTDKEAPVKIMSNPQVAGNLKGLTPLLSWDDEVSSVPSPKPDEWEPDPMVTEALEEIVEDDPIAMVDEVLNADYTSQWTTSVGVGHVDPALDIEQEDEEDDLADLLLDHMD